MSNYPDPNQPHRPEHDRWMTHPDDKDYLPPLERWCRVCTKPDSDPIHTRGAPGSYDPALEDNLVVDEDETHWTEGETMRRVKFDRGIEDLRGAHVTWEQDGRTYLTEVTGAYKSDGYVSVWMLTSRHFDGEPAPDVCTGLVRVLERSKVSC